MQQQLTQSFNAGVSDYLQVREEGDIDLIAHVRKLLIESGLQQNVVESYDTNRFIIEGLNKASHVQRFLLNRFWSLQLSLFNDSIEERFCLIQNGNVNDWIKLFQSKVLPFIIAKNLPQRIG